MRSKSAQKTWLGILWLMGVGIWGGCLDQAKVEPVNPPPPQQPDLTVCENGCCDPIQCGQFAWARQSLGADRDEGWGVGRLSDGSLVLTGVFTVELKLGQPDVPEVLLGLTSAEAVFEENRGFIARYRADGKLDWAKRCEVCGKGLATLADDSFLVSGNGVARYTARGELVWSREIQDSIPNIGGAKVAAWPDGSFVLTGAFERSLTLGKGEPRETTLVEKSSKKVMYVARLDAEGRLIWARKVGSKNGEKAHVRPEHAALWPDGSSAVVGSFSHLPAFGAGEAHESIPTYGDRNQESHSHIFIARYSQSGDLDWVKFVGGTNASSAMEVAASSAIVDAQGDLVVGGYFSGTTVFEAESAEEVVLTAASISGFVARFRAHGELVSARPLGSTIALSRVLDLDVYPDGGLVVAGVYAEQITLGSPDSGEVSLSTELGPGQATLFLARYRPDGSLLWADSAAGGWSEPNAVVALPEGGAALTGTVATPTIFGKGESAEVRLDATDFELLVVNYAEPSK